MNPNKSFDVSYWLEVTCLLKLEIFSVRELVIILNSLPQGSGIKYGVTFTQLYQVN